jgi:hypothetical protein
MTGPVYDYPAYGADIPPAWSRGWDPVVGPSWETDTDVFPVIKIETAKHANPLGWLRLDNIWVQLVLLAIVLMAMHVMRWAGW